ncbi:PhoD-like phosphatase N-terminal domain-containing protein [Melittangium boletus]|uniref:PhoD-like phosphatase N-terminal domain-containing protein n=1 Tax=Melittangium boletus TaxID=83453 RepID=UPI0012FE655D|nr:PhoD-like phosphatase N-terminal domain-containing protein [Melittangium boletus]
MKDGQAYFPQAVASGEPGAHDVVLWTRAVDPRHPGARLSLSLQVARDARFEHRVLESSGLSTSCAHDHTLKVRVTNLEPCTRYHYRFLVEKDGQCLGSVTGRTRTGPESLQERPLHFVVAHYQDFLRGGRLLAHGEDPDFILFMADSLHDAGGRPLAPSAAPSVSRSRDLCRAWRALPGPRRWHTDYPVLVMWDDTRPARWQATRRALCDYLPVDMPAEPLGEGPRTRSPVADAA